MAKKLTEAQLQELNHKYEWSLTIVNYAIAKYPNSNFQMLKEAISEAFNRQDLRGMRYVYSDMNEMATMASKQEELAEINVLLKEKFGFDFNLVNKKDIQKVKRILKRGTIANADEHRFLLSRVDAIYDNKEYLEELNAINALLSAYTEIEKD
jgi:2-oxo-4-hydroxy-4-carboxy--5-ureidoimidazoline (OHCU) decarboxylase